MDVLEPSRDPEGRGSDDLTGQKKSRMKPLKSRLLGKIKRKEVDDGLKQTQSESDITWGVTNSQDEHCSQGMLGSRAFSHDSIFLAEDRHSDPEPPRVLSHEDIHEKVRALQMKLQQQKMHLGPPPLLLPNKHHIDIGAGSEEDGHSLVYESMSNKVSSQPLSQLPCCPVSSPISHFATSSGVDFNIPPQVTSLLDNSAARHRMSVKPKNQRATAKNKKSINSAEHRPRSDSMKNSLTDREEGSLSKETPHSLYSSKVLRTGDRKTASSVKYHPPVSPLISLQDQRESRQLSTQNEKNLLFTSPQRPGQMELITAETPESTTIQEPTKETKCLPKLVEAHAVKPLSVDRKETAEMKSSCLLRKSQSNLVRTLETGVQSRQETNIIQDEKSIDIVIQKKMDTINKCTVQNAGNVENLQSSTQAPVNVISGLNLRPSSLRRNAPVDCESKTLQPVMTVSTGQDKQKTESTKWQRPLSGSFHLTVSSDKIQERPRTASFTGFLGQAGQRKEPPSPLNPNIKGQHSLQGDKTKEGSSCSLEPVSQKEDGASTHPVITKKFTNPTTNRSKGVEENQESKIQEFGVEATEEEVQEGVEEAEEAGEDVTEGDEKYKEASNAFGVKLRSSSLSLKFRLDKAQSDIRVKQQSSEVAPLSPPLVLPSGIPSLVKPEDHHTMTGLKLNDHSLQTTESSKSSNTLMSVCQGKEKTALLSQAEPCQYTSLPSKATKILPSLPKETADLPAQELTGVYPQEKTATSTTSELSWMEMAKEKTRSLQQLFTSRLPEFPGLQSTTRPTSLNTTQRQASTSEVNPRTTQNITVQQTQLPLRPTEVPARHPLSAQPLGKSIQHMESNRTTTSQSQVDTTREVLFQSKPQICYSTTKPTQSPVTCMSNIQSTSHTIYTAKSPSHPRPIQHSSLHAGAFQATQTSPVSLHPTPTPTYPCLSSSPKMTSNLMPQQSASTVSKNQLQNLDVESSTAAGKVDSTVHQGKRMGLEDGRPLLAADPGNKTPLVKKWENQSTTATKVGEQKDTLESQTTAQSTAPIKPISDTGIDPNASVSCVATKAGVGDNKWQSPSPSHSGRGSGQPSWMELAKRKSLAWSDKTMD